MFFLLWCDRKRPLNTTDIPWRKSAIAVLVLMLTCAYDKALRWLVVSSLFVFLDCLVDALLHFSLFPLFPSTFNAWHKNNVCKWVPHADADLGSSFPGHPPRRHTVMFVTSWMVFLTRLNSSTRQRDIRGLKKLQKRLTDITTDIWNINQGKNIHVFNE